MEARPKAVSVEIEMAGCALVDLVRTVDLHVGVRDALARRGQFVTSLGTSAMQAGFGRMMHGAVSRQGICRTSLIGAADEVRLRKLPSAGR